MQSNTIRRDLEAVKIFFLQMCNFAVDQGVSRKGKTGFARGRASRSQGARQTREARGRHAKRGRGTRDAHRARRRHAKHVGVTRSERAKRTCGHHAKREPRIKRAARTRSEEHASSARVSREARGAHRARTSQRRARARIEREDGREARMGRKARDRAGRALSSTFLANRHPYPSAVFHPPWIKLDRKMPKGTFCNSKSAPFGTISSI